MDPLLERVLIASASTVGVREVGDNNRGPEVEAWLARVGLPPGEPWCAAWLWSMFDDAATALGIGNPVPRTGSAMRLWERTDEGRRVHIDEIASDASRILPGWAFVISRGGGKGHVGLVSGVDLSTAIPFVNTVEANTNTAGSREGDGVYQRRRAVAEINVGFLDYATPEPFGG